MLNILIVDDHTIFRTGLQRLLMDEPDMRIAAAISNGSDIQKLLASRTFDVILLDINLDGRNGFDILASMRSQGCKTPVLVLSMYPEKQYALLAIQAGANGYITKDAVTEELSNAIRQTAAGNQYLSPAGAMYVHEQLNGKDARPAHQRLSIREHQIMLMLVKGVQQTEIGKEMMISAKTVNSHRSNLMEKLGVKSNSELVLYAVRNGLID